MRRDDMKSQVIKRLGSSVLEGEESTVLQKHNPKWDTLVVMCPPCVIWMTHNAVMCVLHAIQKLFVQTCVSTSVWQLCVFDTKFSVRQWRQVFMSEVNSEVFLWFHIFVLAVDAGVLSQIYDFFFLLLFWSEELCCCEVWFCFCLWGPHWPLVLCCQLFFCFFYCKVSPPPLVSYVWPQSALKSCSAQILKISQAMNVSVFTF